MNLRFLTYIFIVAFCYWCIPTSAQSPTGTWLTIDDQSNERKSHVKIYENNGKLFGEIVKILNNDPDALCVKCPGELKNEPVLGLVIIDGLEKDGDEWNNGTILDPEKGKRYKCQITLKEKDILEVRGYIGLPAFGRSQMWKRIK